MTIKLELNGHCIETASKEKLQQLLGIEEDYSKGSIVVIKGYK